MPAAKTKDPTPRSIRELPKLSVLAKRRGKTDGKSTAKIEVQVLIIMAPRYVVMKGLTGSGSRSLGGCASFLSVGLPFATDLAGGFAVLSSYTADCRSVAMHGRISSPFKTCGAPE